MNSFFNNKHLYLIGFMGAGKTTIGKLLAENLNRPFIDIDDVIEKNADLTVPMIFEKYGEKFFRNFEAEILQRVVNSPGGVIATGGGIILKVENRKLLKRTGITIYLKWQTNTLYQRIKNSTHRPLLKSINESQLEEHIEHMLKQREKYYEQADIIINANEAMSPAKIVGLIIQQLSSEIILNDEQQNENIEC